MKARMRLATLVIGIVALLPAVSPAAEVQHVEGTVFVPAGDMCAYPEALLRTALRAGWVVAHSFNVHPASYGKPFSLSANRDLADLDITFFGTTIRSFSKRSLKGEAGIVPSGATKALVCLVLGLPSRFTYRAG